MLSAPDLEPSLAALLDALGELCEINAREILPLAVSAHGRSVASVRDLRPLSESVIIDGQPKRWELALRPLFFLSGDPLQRLSTLVHELLHLDPSGGLLESRRHAQLSKAELDEQARALVEPWLARGDRLSLIAPLGHHGWLRLRQWRARPVEGEPLSRYTERELSEALVEMRTRPELRTVWW